MEKGGLWYNNKVYEIRVVIIEEKRIDNKGGGANG